MIYDKVTERFFTDSTTCHLLLEENSEVVSVHAIAIEQLVCFLTSATIGLEAVVRVGVLVEQ
jgi:hypothetical protein